MQYLMIKNPGTAQAECFTILGVSTTRFAGSEQTIGQFGSGSKHAVSLLLRNDINPIIYVGNLKLEFFTKPMPVSDGLSEHEYRRVVVKYGGTDPVTGKNRSATEELSVTLEHGTYDWTDMSMALREFVSNALDRTFRENGDFAEVEIEIVDKPRAVRGGKHTAVFIPLTPDVQRFYHELPKRFLHFKEVDNLGQKILPKNGRNLTENKKTTMVYKKGVFIREFSQDDLPSLYDYNLGNELTLDENRHVDDHAIKAAVSRAIVNARSDELMTILKAITSGEQVFEATLSSYQLMDQWADDKTKKTQNENWQAAWKAIAGDDGVAVSDKPNLAEFVKKKGFVPQIIKAENWFAALESHGIRTDNKVLTDTERKGSTLSEPTEDMVLAVEKVWELLKTFDMLNGKEKPPVMAFDEIMDGESQRLGYYSFLAQTVYLHTDLGKGQSAMLLQTALEEVVHHTTQAQDASRDLQDFLFRLIVKMGL